ncbi:MAG TPA: DUF362 domain-containing protein [Armatimonadota bacterium]|jgi:uncharacterized protein (DUF362 family)
MGEKFTRREFFKKAGLIGVATVGLGFGGDLLNIFGDEAEAAGSILSVASGDDPENMVKRAIDGIGGIGRYVKRGNSVCIKPNVAWSRTPSQAANTNPEVLAGVINLCKQAGASRITVVDYTCDPSSVAFNMNGARTVCSKLGVRLVSGDNAGLYRRISIPRGKVLKSDQCLKDVLDSDVFINVPIAKVHGGGTITASMKNLMGVSYERGSWHGKDLHQCIADYASAVKPDLIVLDAVRILLTNGPKGPGETKDTHQIIAGTDPVAIDSYAAKLLGMKPQDVRHIVYASSMGLGQMELSKIAIKRA